MARKLNLSFISRLSFLSSSPSHLADPLNSLTLHFVRHGAHDFFVQSHAHVVHEPFRREQPVRLKNSRHILDVTFIP